MTEAMMVHGTQCLKKRAPGGVTFSVICDHMLNQSCFLQIFCITQGALSG